MKNKTWFITGSSRGFGNEWATAALQRGDNVAATARNVDDLADLKSRFGHQVLPLQLDVTDRAACFEAVEQARAHFGRLDIVVNNAGYGLFGMVEEISEKEARDQMETNFFGALWVTQAALPIMREQQSGRILQVSSIGGIIANISLGLYHASKWALEAFSESLSKEVAGMGVFVTLIEPGGYGTDWSGSSAIHASANPAYDALRAERAKLRGTFKPGDPVATREAILQIADADEPPLRIFLGEQPLGWAKDAYQKRLETWEKWQDVSEKAQGNNNA
ncbi:SDR family oxidoreductase [Mucilaginibacter gossypii]|uniref:NADP-dependent 3-hydroxy acid dehydrogenase YdfG n=1 Tax=Mucilaginibacter gossypii TaxID=551996 RepID=A0A1G8AID7_9SPHI|nr:SDR family oxidoreductase [Mucilaginibacter gossypii]SDH20596.1 NADP-dependent 3-hydroxy acid dehydrogenase YdfG [Mucilaginibacter gossypii]